MTQLISPENQERIKVELFALGGEGLVKESIAELELAAQCFLDDEMERAANTGRKYNPETLLRQVQKVWSHTGQQREEAHNKALRMGLNPGPSCRLRRPFHDVAYHLQKLIEDSHYCPDQFSILTNRESKSKQMLMARCLVVWMQSGGEVRFSIPIDRTSASLRHDGGPLGRFLTAAQVDAHDAACAAQKEAGFDSPVRMPSYQGLRSLALKMRSLAELILESDRRGVNDDEGPLDEFGAPTDLLD